MEGSLEGKKKSRPILTVAFILLCRKRPNRIIISCMRIQASRCVLNLVTIHFDNHKLTCTYCIISLQYFTPI